MSKDKELHISFNFITPKSGFRTQALGNYRNYKDWVTSGFWVDYFTRKDKICWYEYIRHKWRIEFFE
ncbi:hypothetical protein ONA22_03550 [Mycoplasmopsis cynos]|uniref:hypothetical protein n=1 Tax=Mycoplasmopsis cynos TaxID=171284 RepID=UPI0024CC8932|nr:hypothetical protein [Mycoplasmopsis cynos]WAM04031.1 hypothetical protein ONA22_03550 [Mycoplasmopsis cynos]